MSDVEQHSLDELQQRAAEARAAFVDTVGQLRSRVQERASVDALRSDAADYLRGRGELLLDKVRQNPLPAAAIGAGLAYPLLNIVRSIPVPVLLVGSGLFMLGSSTGQRATQKL